MSRKKIRLSLDVSPELYDRLNELAQGMGGNKSDVLRRSVALFDLAHKAVQDGKHVGVDADQDKLDTEYVGL